jgi:hypothetical protein
MTLSPLMGVKASSGGHPQRAESGPIAEPEDFLTGALALERPLGKRESSGRDKPIGDAIFARRAAPPLRGRETND